MRFVVALGAVVVAQRGGDVAALRGDPAEILVDDRGQDRQVQAAHQLVGAGEVALRGGIRSEPSVQHTAVDEHPGEVQLVPGATAALRGVAEVRQRLLVVALEPPYDRPLVVQPAHRAVATHQLGLGAVEFDERSAEPALVREAERPAHPRLGLALRVSSPAGESNRTGQVSACRAQILEQHGDLPERPFGRGQRRRTRRRSGIDDGGGKVSSVLRA